MNSSLSPQQGDNSGSGRRFLLILGGLLLLVYGAYTVQEARRGSWAHLISLGIAVVLYLGLPFAQRRLEAAFPDVKFGPASRPRPLREALWGFVVVFAILAAFILING